MSKDSSIKSLVDSWEDITLDRKSKSLFQEFQSVKTVVVCLYDLKRDQNFH